VDGPILHGMQEVREFDSPRLHQKLQARGDAGGNKGSCRGRYNFRCASCARDLTPSFRNAYCR
jgi:hypothetical protein